MKPFFPRISSSHLPAAPKLIWIHAVSVGEVKAAKPLVEAFKKTYPRAFFFVTTTTTTGQAEARRSLNPDAVRYLPFDLPWVVQRWVRKLKPQLFVLVETDFWPNLLRVLKKAGCKTVLVSGKLSECSARRFRYFLPFAKKLFSQLDLLCVQNEEHGERFLPLLSDPSKLHITGNLKLDLEAESTGSARETARPAIAITCTHGGEEEAILEQLLDLDYSFFLAPRHPERFEEVARLLTRKKIPFSRWNSHEKTKVVLVDTMGQLPICYRSSRLAIVGGSFVGNVGGHNVLEPCLYGIPVFFGPSMRAQKEFSRRVLEAKAGKQLRLEDLRAAVENFSREEASLRQGVEILFEKGRGATEKTFEQVQRLMLH